MEQRNVHRHRTWGDLERDSVRFRALLRQYHGDYQAATDARGELLDHLEPYRVDALDGHPWREWAEADADAAASGQRRPGAQSRWNAGKDLSWEPLRLELVAEVAYEHLQGDRFRHTARFQRWRPDREPASCTYAQLDVPVPAELHDIFGV